MEIVLKKNTELERSLKVVVSAKEFTQKIVDQLSKIQQNAKIDGFRKGKVPINIVRKRFGQEAKNEVINNLIQTTFQEAVVSEKNLTCSATRSECYKCDRGRGSYLHGDF